MAATGVSFASQGIKAVHGVSIHVTTESLDSSSPLPGRVGDLLVSTKTGKWYTTIPILTGATSDWALITSA